ncbi:prevent-host-death family protein [Cohnella sp. SGD-V74]|uniref:type II toxin-antitoxin system prevent-host-death family antitoxin n=1 Tax=unclassified Cohnella TaxID=2636738 RepID=UPI000D412572|nr:MULTISPECIES: type II toxin-antitoxin system prevent-host-death family antitoxin [unclassified Cohnella]PRX68804.1 prevent-host-death family protein [Cohnella sp. SGD-V74]
MQWELQDARNQLSAIVKMAADEGPQIINIRGKSAAIILSMEEYNRLTTPKTRLTDFFKNSPLRGLELNLERNNDFTRKLEL